MQNAKAIDFSKIDFLECSTEADQGYGSLVIDGKEFFLTKEQFENINQQIQQLEEKLWII